VIAVLQAVVAEVAMASVDKFSRGNARHVTWLPV